MNVTPSCEDYRLLNSSDPWRMYHTVYTLYYDIFLWFQVFKQLIEVASFIIRLTFTIVTVYIQYFEGVHNISAIATCLLLFDQFLSEIMCAVRSI